MLSHYRKTIFIKVIGLYSESQKENLLKKKAVGLVYLTIWDALGYPWQRPLTLNNELIVNKYFMML